MASIVSDLLNIVGNRSVLTYLVNSIFIYFNKVNFITSIYILLVNISFFLYFKFFLEYYLIYIIYLCGVLYLNDTSKIRIEIIAKKGLFLKTS